MNVQTVNWVVVVAELKVKSKRPAYWKGRV